MESDFEKNVYVGKDLEAMSFAVEYHRLILEKFRPYLGKHIVEVGAGTGSFSQLLLQLRPDSLALVEPSRTMHRILVTNLKNAPDSTVTFHNTTFRQSSEALRSKQAPDSILYVNVLEHIEDDEHELRATYQTLGSGGRIFIFVPALRGLYSEFDKSIGHFRRYTRNELEKKCLQAGFVIVDSRYFDLLGVLPWWLLQTVLRSKTLNPTAVKVYDTIGVPITRFLETLIRPPVGKNLLLIAQKQ